MTEEEKDILQDKVIREEANYFESNQHKALLAEDDDYKMSFSLKEGIARAAAKDFIQKALETPVISLDEEETKEPKVAAVPAMVASRRKDYSSSQRETSSKNLWMAVAATVLIAAVSTFFLADFRTADEFVVAQLDSGYDSEKLAISSGVSRGGESIWITAFGAGDYDLVVKELRWIGVAESDSIEVVGKRLKVEIINLDSLYKKNLKTLEVDHYNYWGNKTLGRGPLANRTERDIKAMRNTIDSLENELSIVQGRLFKIQTIQPSLEEARFALGISKLFSPRTTRDFGAEELKWLSNQSSAIDSARSNADEVNWYLALAQYKEGNCLNAYETLHAVTEADSDYARDAKKLRRKMRKECGLN